MRPVALERIEAVKGFVAYVRTPEGKREFARAEFERFSLPAVLEKRSKFPTALDAEKATGCMAPHASRATLDEPSPSLPFTAMGERASLRSSP